LKFATYAFFEGDAFSLQSFRPGLFFISLKQCALPVPSVASGLLKAFGPAKRHFGPPHERAVMDRSKIVFFFLSGSWNNYSVADTAAWLIRLVPKMAAQVGLAERGRDAQQSSLCAMQRCVRTLRGDVNAVRNAITEWWSNGQTEGQINRLKTLKRAMYGRPGPELLRARVLPL
jgi:hypothetical protein